MRERYPLAMDPVAKVKERAKERAKERHAHASERVNPLGLNDKQELFCQLYVAQPLPRSAPRAYMEAYGCSENTAKDGGARLLADSRIRTRIHALNSEFTTRHIITRDNVLAGFWDIYQKCINAVPVTDGKGKPVTTTVTVKGPNGKETKELRAMWKFDSKGANAALQSIARYLGLFNADTSGSVNVNLSVEVAAMRDLITAEMSRLHGGDVETTADEVALPDGDAKQMLPQ